MLKSVGIIAEYDPFHAGHAWQIQQARQAGARAVVCVMSPSVVQRGGFALFPTPVRVRAALAGGADLVLSLPAPYATLSAEGFAAAGVHLLSMLGCVDTLCFGAETPDPELLHRTAQTLRRPEFQREMRHALRQGGGFAAARAAAAEAVQPGAAALLASPNNILGVEYCKAIQAQKSPLQVFALARRGAAHGEATPGDGFASASALRTLFQAEGADAMASYVPAACLPLYLQAQSEGLFHDPTAGSIAILSRLRGLSAQDLLRVRGVNEGLEHRLYQSIQSAVSLPALYADLKTKRYAHARLRRLVLDAALGYGKQIPALPPYLHVLGASEQGLAVLKTAKETALLPLSTSLARLRDIAPDCERIARAHSDAEDLAALCLARPQPCQTAYTQPFLRV